MVVSLFLRYPVLILLLALVLPWCWVTTQNLRQEIQDTRAGTVERMAEAEKSYESYQYWGILQKNPKIGIPPIGPSGWIPTAAGTDTAFGLTGKTEGRSP